jgi:hypothetical protein
MRAELLTSLGTLGGIVLTNWLLGKASPEGTAQVPKELLLKIASAVGWVFLGLFSYTIQLWFRDRHRERIKAALERGARICNCTADGVVMLKVKFEPNPFADVYQCPKCKSQRSTGSDRLK